MKVVHERVEEEIVGKQVFVLTVYSEGGLAYLSVHATEDGCLDQLCDYVAENWNVKFDGKFPPDPDEAIKAYFSPNDWGDQCEDYSIDLVTIQK